MKTIVILEDDELVVSMIKNIFAKERKYNVVHYSTIEEMTNHLNKQLPIDILIGDYLINNESVENIVKSLKSKKPQISIVILSDSQDEDIKKRCYDVGVNFYLQKPFTAWELKGIIRNQFFSTEFYANLENASSIIQALSTALDARDRYTAGHSERVRDYSLALYDELGFDDEDERKEIYTGALLHDIGKIGVRDEVLKSNRKLDEEERKEIEIHPQKGFEICHDIKSLQKGTIDIIHYHHEKIDGTGYPEGLKGDVIPLVAQIVSIGDIYDALTSDRAYRNKNSPEDALKIMQTEFADRDKINKYFFKVFALLILREHYDKIMFNTI
jgi:putative two-component system response regulator